MTPSACRTLLEDYQRDSVAQHGVFQHLRSLSASPTKLWLLVKNLDVGMAECFTQWLAQSIASCPNLAIRSILAHQLDDELGNGDPSRVHRLLFERFLSSLDPYALPGERFTAPGRKLRAYAEELFDGTRPYQAVGALMTLEVLAEQFDAALAKELRRCENQVDQQAARWVFLHEELEQEHAGDSFTLAEFVPADVEIRKMVLVGAIEVRRAAVEFLDEVLGLFPELSTSGTRRFEPPRT